MYPIGCFFVAVAADFPNGFVFLVLLCSIPFSRRVAYWYESCGLRVSAIRSSAIFSLFMCAVNMYLTRSSLLLPQSAREASSTRSAWCCLNFWASLSYVISISCMRSVGSTNVGLGCSKFLTLMLSFANTAISKIAAHFDQKVVVLPTLPPRKD